CGHTEKRTLTGPGRKRVRAQFESREERTEKALKEATKYVPSDVKLAEHIPEPPFWGARIVDATEINLDDIFTHINKRALFRGQWQYRRGRRSESEYRGFIAEVVEPKFKEWCERVKDRKWLAPKVAYGYFPCNSRKNSLIVYHPVRRDEVA